MRVDLLPQGRQQPFYHVLVDVRDRPGGQTTYVAQARPLYFCGCTACRTEGAAVSPCHLDLAPLQALLLLCPGPALCPGQPLCSLPASPRLQENVVPALVREVQHPLTGRLFSSFEPGVGYLAGPELRAAYPADF